MKKDVNHMGYMIRGTIHCNFHNCDTVAPVDIAVYSHSDGGAFDLQVQGGCWGEAVALPSGWTWTRDGGHRCPAHRYEGPLR